MNLIFTYYSFYSQKRMKAKDVVVLPKNNDDERVDEASPPKCIHRLETMRTDSTSDENANHIIDSLNDHAIANDVITHYANAQNKVLPTAIKEL